MVDEWCVGERPVVAIGGNHDAESDLPGRLRLPRSAHWFAAEQPSTLELPALGLAVHGVSVRERDDVRRVFEAYPEPVAGAFNIAMLHSSLDLAFSKRVCLPVGLDELRGDERYDAWALGHVHRRLVLHEKPLIAYPGGAHAQSENGSGARGFAMFEIGADRSARVTEVDVALEVPAPRWGR
jgi:DNA repair exonuclease SbcCD nuclease subunit